MRGYGARNAPTTLGRHEIELRMRAIRDHVPALRTLVAERTMRVDHDLDFIDDIRLAVDEIYAIMLAQCDSSAMLTMRLAIGPDRVEIDASAPLEAARQAKVDGLGEVGGLGLRVLQALADALDYSIDDSLKPVLRLSFCRERR